MNKSKQLLLLWHPDSAKAFAKRFSKLAMIKGGTLLKQKKITLVSNKKEFFQLLQKKEFRFDYTFILLELGWSQRDWEGYQVALSLFEYFPKMRSDIMFASFISRKELLQIVPADKADMVRAFEHINLHSFPIELNLPGISSYHSQLLRSLLTDGKDIIDFIIHDLNKLINNATPQKKINEGFKMSVLELQKKIMGAKRFLKGKKILELTRSINIEWEFTPLLQRLQDIRIELEKEERQTTHDPQDDNFKKSDYRVLVVEDSEAEMVLLETELKKYYKVVKSLLVSTEQSYTDAMALLKDKSTDFDIAFVDLLFKNKAIYYSPYNGFDFIALLKERMPHIAIRIVTNMPRGLIGKIRKDISVHHILSKSKGKNFLPYRLEELVEDLNEECIENERLRDSENPGPWIGMFGKPGLRNAIINMRFKALDQYRDLWDSAYDHANAFRNNTLSSENWSTRLPSNDTKKNMPVDRFVKTHLSNILSHRLIVFYLASQNDYAIVRKDRFEQFDCLQDIVFNKSYLNARLGIHASKNVESSQSDAIISGFKIGLKNLFKEEVLWLEDANDEIDFDLPLDSNSHLKNWVENICNALYKIDEFTWHNLPKDPNQWKKCAQLNEVLKFLIDHYAQYEALIEPLVDECMELPLKNVAIPKKTKELIDKFTGLDIRSK